MRLRSLRIQNFRSFTDETITLDDYSCFVGSNGAGKSAILTALNVFFRNNASTATDVQNMTSEDFHHKNTTEPIRITVTFEDLSPEAQEDFKHYYRQGQLTVFSKAVWDPESEAADVRQYGVRLVVTQFASFFEAEAKATKVAALKEIYEGIKKDYPTLPDPGSKQAMIDALRSYEEDHPGECALLDDTNQFYGWSKGANLLSKYLQWVYIPAVKDASTEQEEGSNTALGQLLERTVRTKVSFNDPIAALKRKLEESYRKVIDQEQSTLAELATSIKTRLQSWANPGAELSLDWHYDPNKSLVVKEPVARVSIGEDGFIGEVPRLGHGMQRSFLLAILQELASADQEGSPTLLLGFEEPELYQHPPQAQHIAAVLEKLASAPERNTQVLVTTHSPYFVSAKGFESIRLVRKSREKRSSIVKAATYDAIEKRLADALGESPGKPSALMATVGQIMQPSQRELFFTRVAILVEGVEDVAFISTHLQLTKKWDAFRENGCHFVVCGGKVSLSRPLAIACELDIRCFVVFDSDSDESKAADRKNNRRNNACILRLCGFTEADPLPSDDFWSDKLVMWHTNIFDGVKLDIGGAAWDSAEQTVRAENHYTTGVRRKNSLLISATLEKLNDEGKTSTRLTTLCDRILAFAQG